MGRLHYAQNNFTGGEVSPKAYGATDTVEYHNGSEILLNHVVLPQGGAYRRLGTVLNSTAADTESRLMTWGEDVDDLVIEMAPNLIRVWDDETIVFTSGAPWQSGEIFTIATTQDGNEMVFFSDREFQILTRTVVGWSFGALAAQDIPDYHFEDDPLAVAKVHSLQFAGTWADGDWFRLVVNGFETTRAFYTADNTEMARRIERILRPYVLIEALGLKDGLEVVHDVGFFFNITFNAGIKGLDYLIQPGDGEALAASAAISIVVTILAAGDFFEPAWSDARGWPRAGCFWQQRLWAGGTDLLPQTLFATRIGTTADFLLGPDDGDGLGYKIKSQTRVGIQWMSGKKGMAIGTTGGDFVVPRETGVVTPTNVHFELQTVHRSKRAMPVEVDSETFYLQAGGKKLRTFNYQWNDQSWQSYDLIYTSDHLAEDGIKELAYTDHPDTMVWGVTENGLLLGMTYERARGIIAWHPHATNGTFKSVAVRHKDGSDQLWFVVSRINGTYIEKIPYTSQEYYRLERITDTALNPTAIPFGTRVKIRPFDAFADSAVITEGSGLTEITGLLHLISRPVDVVGDEANLPGLAVNSSGVLVLPPKEGGYSRVIVGEHYSGAIRPLPLETGHNSQSAGVKYVKPTVRLADSAMPKINGQRPKDRSVTTPLDDPEGMRTGDFNVTNFSYDGGQIDIESDLPFPCHVLMHFGWLDVNPE